MEAPTIESTNTTGSEAARGSPLRSRRVRAGLLLVAIAVFLLGLWWYLNYQARGKFLQETNDATIQADSVVVAPRVGGYIDRVFVSENQTVRAGQALALLDTRDYRAQTAQIQAQIEAAGADAATIRAQVGEQQAALMQARAQLQAAVSDAAFAASEVARYEPLALSGAEPRERLAQLRNQLRQAEAQTATRRLLVLGAQRRFITLGSQIDQAKSQARAAKAQLAAATVNLQSTTVRASIGGKIGNLTGRVGQYVQPGTRLMTLVPIDQIYVLANFKETQVGLMRIGQPAKLAVDALPGIELQGSVASFAPGTGAQFSVLPPQNATGNFTKIVQRIPVRIAITASRAVRDLLAPGMSVVVTVDTLDARDELDRIRKSQAAGS